MATISLENVEFIAEFIRNVEKCMRNQRWDTNKMNDLTRSLDMTARKTGKTTYVEVQEDVNTYLTEILGGEIALEFNSVYSQRGRLK